MTAACSMLLSAPAEYLLKRDEIECCVHCKDMV